MSENRYDDMPCGRCDVGVYDFYAMMAGFEAYADCASPKQALSRAPRCKDDPSHVCFGARDWIVTAGLPMNEQDKARLLKEMAA